MQNPIRTVGLGLLLATSAVAVRAEPKKPNPAPPIQPAATQASSRIDLSVHPATTPFGLPGVAGTPTATPASGLRLSSPAPAAAPATGPVDALQSASDEVKRVVRWVVDSNDNAGLPFLLIDKVNAQVFVFTPAGLLQGATPALLGMAHGDRLLAPNSATMEQMAPNVRITPAGRFVSKLAIDSLGKELLVLDYDASISLHAVVKGTPQERRAERLNSPTSQDNRISFGCINVPTAFYSTIVSPAFTRTKGIVYVLPETKPAGELFGFQPAGTGAPVTPATSGAAQGAAAVGALATGRAPASVAR